MSPDALIVTCDAKIDELLKRDDSVVIPAFSCRLDGFVNDTFTEYANCSVYRPASVSKARLVSVLNESIRNAGNYYFGFTMYTMAGRDESVEVWMGHQRVAIARIPAPDNRVHLFVAPQRIRFRGGERFRLVTNESNGPCRIENVVLLRRRPRPSIERLEISSPKVDLRLNDGKPEAIATWVTNRPAVGTVSIQKGKGRKKTSKITDSQCAHEAVFASVEPDADYSYEIKMKDRTGKLSASHTGRFRTKIRTPRSRVERSKLAIQLRRPSPKGMPWPISVGVPIPEGDLGNLKNMRICSNDGTSVPAQLRVLGKWPDESVRWVLADFKSDGCSEYTAEYGRKVSAATIETGIEVLDSRKGIRVDTGPLRIEFPRDRTILPGLVSVRSADGTWRTISPKKSAPAATIVDAHGEVYHSGKPDSLIVEESGPERVCVKVCVPHLSSKGEKLFASTFRVHLFRDSSLIRVLHTFENDRTEEEFTHIREMSLRSDFQIGNVCELSLGNQRYSGTKPVNVVQSHDNRFECRQAKRLLTKGRRFDGGAEIVGERATVALSVRDFWQNYPKGIALDSQGLSIQICPPVKKGDYPKGTEEEDRLYFYLLDGTYKFKRGVSRTHEFWLDVRSSTEVSSTFHACVQHPPLYCVSLEAFNNSKAVTRLPSKVKSPYPPYEDWVEAARDAYAEDRKESRAYGMLNFGDWFGERTYNWGNMEYDTSWCFLQEYLRGGHPDFFNWAAEAAGHLVDVDTPHCSAAGQQEGGQYTHCVGHVGGYYPDGYRERAIFQGQWKVSHTWVEGLFLYHLLTGDTRALEGAMKASKLLLGASLNDYDFTNCRNSGWHLIHLSAAYKTTGRRVFMNAARIIVDRVLERQRDSGGWDRLMVPGHCLCMPPRHTGNAGFMVGILMVGLKRYYEATGDKRAADAIVRAADYCIDTMWVPERAAFHYTCCPESNIGGAADMRILKGVATAYRFTGEKRFKDVLLAGVESSMGGYRPKARRGIGKGICSPMRGAPQVLVELS